MVGSCTSPHNSVAIAFLAMLISGVVDISPKSPLHRVSYLPNRLYKSDLVSSLTCCNAFRTVWQKPQTAIADRPTSTGSPQSAQHATPHVCSTIWNGDRTALGRMHVMAFGHILRELASSTLPTRRAPRPSPSLCTVWPHTASQSSA